MEKEEELIEEDLVAIILDMDLIEAGSILIIIMEDLFNKGKDLDLEEEVDSGVDLDKGEDINLFNGISRIDFV